MKVVFPNEIPDVHLFRNLVIDVRLLMDLYFDHIVKQKAVDGLVVEFPNSYVLVRAIELSLFGTSNVKFQSGFCAFCFSQNGLIKMRSKVHSWLTWKEEYIIDVLPVDGMFGISVPQAIFPTSDYKRFSIHENVYAENFSPKVLQNMDDESERLSYIFDELMSKVPS